MRCSLPLLCRSLPLPHPLTGVCAWSFLLRPIRQIPGTHTNVQLPPPTDEEPEWMRLSTLVGAPAGSGIFRDHRAWHGATPNLSNEIRCMPNIEWSAAWTAGPHIPRTMPHHIWQTLTPHGQHICRFVHAEPGVWPPVSASACVQMNITIIT